MYVFFGESVEKVKDWDDFNSLPVSPLQNGNEVERVDGAGNNITQKDRINQ